MSTTTELKQTARGFDVLEFTDRYDVKCSLQKSSLASEDAIWFGCNDSNPRQLIPGQGWQPIQMPAEYVADTRMHLTRDQVAELLPYLQSFVATGDLECRTAAHGEPSKGCDNCRKCLEGKFDASGIPLVATHMCICPDCGDKRCKKADDHTVECSSSQACSAEQVSEREAFEAAMRSQWANIALARMLKNPNKYASDHVNCAWIAWQARAALQHTAPAPSKAGEWTDEQIDEMAWRVSRIASERRGNKKERTRKFVRAFLSRTLLSSAPAQAAQSEDAGLAAFNRLKAAIEACQEYDEWRDMPPEVTQELDAAMSTPSEKEPNNG